MTVTVFSVPAVILGFPIPGSENPYLTASTGEARASMEVYECGKPEIAYEGLEGIRGLLEGFWRRLTEGMELSACTRIRLETTGRMPLSGLYAGLTTALIYKLAREYGESLDTLEALELARYADPFYEITSLWPGVVDALRYNVVESGITVYRNEEEHYRLAEGILNVRYEGSARVGDARVTKESVGSDVYSALIHTMGVTVLEATLRIGDGKPIGEAVTPMIPVHEGIAKAVWGVSLDKCMPSPGLPYTVEKICL